MPMGQTTQSIQNCEAHFLFYFPSINPASCALLLISSLSKILFRWLTTVFWVMPSLLLISIRVSPLAYSFAISRCLFESSVRLRGSKASHSSSSFSSCLTRRLITPMRYMPGLRQVMMATGDWGPR
jgi:hypothetical protein